MPIPSTLPPSPAAAPPDELAPALEGAPEPIARAAAHAFHHSPFLRRLMRQRAETLRTVAQQGPEAAFSAALAAAAAPEPATAPRLRRARADVALSVALADIAGIWPLETVTAALSDFADLALDAAISAAIAERTPGAQPQGLAALALGKGGSRELNYSSDLDIILLFDRAILPVRPRADPDEEAVRLSRRVLELMQGRDADGYVARLDLRLRPSPEVTPIAIPVSAAVHYYQAEALPWERAAFIRSRVAAGDRALGQAFLDEIAPFVWRRSLDFQAIREVQAISLRIRDHFDASQRLGPGFDLKRGRGGIREIEFFAQMHQMIYGGRDPALRTPATLDALARLAAAGRIPAQDADSLAAAYRYLRAAEHRAQMVEDAQTHAIPENDDARADYARFCGYADWPDMLRELEAVTQAVAPVYDRVGERPEPAAAPAPLPAGSEPLVGAWRSGARRCLRSEAARAAFAEIEPALLSTLSAGPEPQVALARLDRFLTALPSGVGFFTLLAANPPLVGLLGRLLSATPVLADELARRPDLFDILLDPGAMSAMPSLPVLEADLAGRLVRARDLEQVLEGVRRFTAERRFQIGAQLLENAADPLAAGRAYSDLADAGLEAIVQAVEAEFAARHGRVAGASLIVLAMGRYGGRMLTARSDLDLVLLHGGGGDAYSDGEKPLHISTWFVRLGQRLVNALSVPTASGALYEVDTRLRPSGRKGVLVASLDSFARYQREEAWEAEHMALTRARVVHATAGDREAAQTVISVVLAAPRDPAALRLHALNVRLEMERHKPGGGLYDVKLAPGGLVDLEFLVQVVQLESGLGHDPDLGTAIEQLIVAGLLPSSLAEAHGLLTRVLILERLVFRETSGRLPDPPPEAEAFLARGVGQGEAASLRSSLVAAKSEVRAAWAAVFGTPREE